jgi:HK97 family phage portal protein
MLARLRSRPADTQERSTINLSQYAALWQDQFVGYSPVPVSVQTAVTNAACSAVIDTLATSVSTLPIDGVRVQGERRIPVTPTPSLLREPSLLDEQDVWMYKLVDSLMTDGNSFGEITSTTALPTSIELIDPGIVSDRRVIDGVPTVLVLGVRRKLWPYGDVWHVPGKFPKAGTPFAQSPIDRARSTIGAAIAARDFGAHFFADGGHPGGILTKEGDLTSEQASALKRAFLAATRGNREPMVMSADTSYQPIMVDPNDSQFLDLMRFAVEEACRFWKVPPSMVYAATSGQNVTYANVTQYDLNYLKHSLEGSLVRIEKALSRLLPKPQIARFNRNAFLRSDPVTRSEVVDRRLKNKTMSVNQARALEDEQPWSDPEFDKPGIPGAAAPPAPPEATNA